MKTHTNPIQKLLSCSLLILSVLFSGLALAQTLDEAKAAGLVGEQRDGYLGLVENSAPQAVIDLVENVNRQRRERYQQIAQENGVPVTEVAKLAFTRAVEATRSGHFVQDANGQWVRKP